MPFLIGTGIMFLAKFFPAPWGLTDGGFQVLATLAGALIMWLTLPVDWTCIVVLLSLCLTPGLGMKAVSAGTLGNDTVMFVILCFILASCLEKTGVSRRLCIWFLTNRLARRGPWWTIAMMLLSVFVLTAILPAVAAIMIVLPIFCEIFKELGYEKTDNAELPAAVTFGAAMSASFAVAASPIGHAQTIVGMSSYNVYTGDTLDIAEFMAVGLPVGLVALIICTLVIKLLWRPDVSRLRGLDYDAKLAALPPMTKAEKWAAGTYIAVAIFWLLPGIMKSLSPAAYEAFFSKLNTWYPPIVAIVLLMNVNTENGPVLDFKAAMASVPWGTCLFVGTIMFIGSTFSNPELGLTEWMSEVLAPVVGSIDPIIFVVIVLVFSLVATNLISNTVTVAIAFAISMPLLTGGLFDGQLNAKVLAILLTVASNMAFATPPSSPPVAIVCGSGWISAKLMCKWGIICAVIGLFVLLFIGFPLGNLICA